MKIVKDESFPKLLELVKEMAAPISSDEEL